MHWTTQDHKQLSSKAKLCFFFEMDESVFWRDKEVKTKVTFHVITSSEIPDMASSDILDTTCRVATRRRMQEIAKCFAFDANSII